MLIHKNHPSIRFGTEVVKICELLFQKTEINYFIYARFYDDGSHFSLPSNTAWHEYFWKMNYQINSQERLKEGIHLWSARDVLNQPGLEAREKFNMDKKFEIVERGVNYYDVFGFATSANNDRIVEFYINNLDYLRQFCFYFKDKARKIIKISDKLENKLFVPKLKDNNFLLENEKKLPNIQKATRHYDLGLAKLSYREMECLIEMIKGKTAEEIGKKINISPKTVESYILSVKEKLKCKTRASLFKTAYKLHITSFLNWDSY